MEGKEYFSFYCTRNIRQNPRIKQKQHTKSDDKQRRFPARTEPQKLQLCVHKYRPVPGFVLFICLFRTWPDEVSSGMWSESRGVGSTSTVHPLTAFQGLKHWLIWLLVETQVPHMIPLCLTHAYLDGFVGNGWTLNLWLFTPNWVTALFLVFFVLKDYCRDI